MDVKPFLGYNKPTAEGAGMDRNDNWYITWHGYNMTHGITRRSGRDLQVSWGGL